MVDIRKQDGITIVTIQRPEARNAVDRATAEALAQAFRDFDVDPSSNVAILTGAGGNFCAGADLKRFGNRLSPDGDAPMGPTRMRLSTPSPAGWSWRSGAICVWPLQTRSLEFFADGSVYR